MTKKQREKITASRTKRKYSKGTRQDELLSIVRHLLLTTLVLSIIALVAAALNIDSRDFWEVIRAAIGLQGILQGSRIFAAMNR